MMAWANIGSLRTLAADPMTSCSTRDVTRAASSQSRGPRRWNVKRPESPPGSTVPAAVARDTLDSRTKAHAIPLNTSPKCFMPPLIAAAI
jgi:hypothetical protein